MAYNGTLTTEEEIAGFAGANVNATGDTEALHNVYVAQAEAFICLLSKYDYVTNYASLNSIAKKILSEYCARYAAVAIIGYDATAITTAVSLIEAEDRITVHLYRMQAIETLLQDQNYVTLIVNGF